MAIVAQRFDSNLGRWTHTDWRPAPGHPLGWAVDRVWDFDGMAVAPQERVFPNGLLELIVQLDDRYLDVTAAGAVPTPAACVTGIFSQPAVVQAPAPPLPGAGRAAPTGGRLGAAGHPLCELAELTADLGDLLGRAGARAGGAVPRRRTAGSSGCAAPSPGSARASSGRTRAGSRSRGAMGRPPHRGQLAAPGRSARCEPRPD